MSDFFENHPVISFIAILVIIVALAFIIAPLRNVVFHGNEQIIDTNWRYEWGIIQLGNGELIEGEITSWKDFKDSDMIQFTMDGISYLTHSSNVILCSECP